MPDSPTARTLDIWLPVTPVGKPRQTQQDKWKKRPAVMRYRAFCDELRMLIQGREIPMGGVHLTFYMPMTASWSAKKKASMEGEPHQQKPDVDNLVKAVFDALLKEDAGIWDVRATKIWASEGGILIRDIEESEASNE